MRGIYLRKLFIELIVCASAMVLALSSTSTFGAVRDDEDDTVKYDGPVLTYICDEDVWYKIVPNEKIRAEFADDDTHVMDFVIQVSGEDDKVVVELCFSDESSFDIAQVCSDTHEDILNYRGAYMMECDGTLYFAVCVFDVNGDAQTYLWREDDVKTVCIAGDLEKTDGVVSVRETLSSGVEKVTTMNQEKWIQQSEISFDGEANFTLSRPLLVAAEINLNSSTEMLIFPAGSDVTITDFLEHDGYGWYYVETGDDSGWLPVENGHLVLQDADFYDTFALPGSEITCRDTLNDSWMKVEEDAEATVIFSEGTQVSMNASTTICLAEYIDGINDQVYLDCSNVTAAYIRVIDFDDSIADTFISVQYPLWHTDGSYATYCSIYRIVGCHAILMHLVDETGIGLTTFPVISAEYTDPSSIITNGDGILYVEYSSMKSYQLEDLYKLVIMESGEPQDEEEITDETYEIM